MTDSRIDVVIVTFNSERWIGQCIESVRRSTIGTHVMNVIVVDNASVDDTLGSLARLNADVTVARNSSNVGFAKAVNQGCRLGESEWILLLNPDCVVGEESIANLVDFATSRPEFGLFGGRNENLDGTSDPSSCWGLLSIWSAVCFATGLSTLGHGTRAFDPESLGGWRRDSVRRVPMVSGAFLLVRRDLWNRLGGFDERFWVYGEDADLARRAGNLGFDSIITPAAVIHHANGASSSTRADKMSLVMAGKVTYAQKHFPALRSRLVVALLVSGVWLRRTASRALGHGTVWGDIWTRRNEWRGGFGQSSRS